MKRAVLVFIGLLFAVYVVAIFVPIEPAERRPGGRLGGDLAEGQDSDLSFVQGRKQILVETRTWYLIPHSVTTTSWASQGEFYVPCGDCDSKRWPKNVQRDPRVRLKVDGKLYQRTAVRITDATERRRLLSVPGSGSLPEGVAVFRMDPRSE
jgi:hypothetical protein